MQRHLTAEEVELWAQGLLPAAQALHLARCTPCLAEAERERKLLRELTRLQRFGPSTEFPDKVMAQVRIPTPSGGFGRE